MLYNIKQEEVIKSKEEKIVIIAPPGSGKTYTMVGAVKEFLKEDPVNVAVITFTNKAADDIAAKISFDNRVEISTIHSWSYRELVKLSEQYEFRVKLLGEAQIKEVIRPFMKKYNISSTYLNSVYNHVIGNINTDLPYHIKSKYDAVETLYRNYKRKMYLYDFTDLPLYLKTQLETYNEYIYIDGLFVDEFQDVDLDQLSVFNRVVARKKFFIGDADQAIYIFRGATEEIFQQLPGFKAYKLNTNYRSYQEILNFAYDFKNQKKDKITDTMFVNIPNHGVLATRGKGGIVIQETKQFGISKGKLYNIGIKYERGKEVQGRVNDLVLEELKEYDYQFLCRTNKEVKQLQKMGFDATTIHQAKGLEFDNVAVIDFEIKEKEDRNVAFVALTRAKNRLMVISLANYLKEGAAKMAF